MRWHLWTAFSSVCEDDLVCVNGESAIWVDGYTEQTRVRLQKGYERHKFNLLQYDYDNNLFLKINAD